MSGEVIQKGKNYYSFFYGKIDPHYELQTWETDIHRDAVFCEGGRLKGEAQAMELDSPQNKTTLYWPRMVLQQQDDGPEHTKATMIRTNSQNDLCQILQPL